MREVVLSLVGLRHVLLVQLRTGFLPGRCGELGLPGGLVFHVEFTR